MQNAYKDIEVNWEFFIGDDVEQQIGLGAAETPMDITGYDINMQLRKKYGAAAVAVNLNIGNGGIVVDDAGDGLFTFKIPRTVTSQFIADKVDFGGEVPYALFYYDVELRRISTDTTKKYLVGTFKFYGEVTK